MAASLSKIHSNLLPGVSSHASSKNGLPKENFKEKLFSHTGEKAILPSLDTPEEVVFSSSEAEPVETEKSKRIAELLEKGELPLLHELAFFLETDSDALTEALQQNGANWLLILTGASGPKLEMPLQEKSGQAGQKAAALAHKAIQFFHPFFMKSSLKENSAELRSLQRQKALELAFSHYQTESSSLNGAAGEESARIFYAADPSHGFSQPMSKAEQYAFHTQSKPGLLNAEQFAEKFMSILQKSSLAHMPNGTKLLIKLYPEQLGSLRIELLQQDGLMTAKFVSSTQAVKELIEQNVHHLKQAFSQQSLKVEEIEVNSLPEKPLHEKNQDEQKHQHKNNEPSAAFKEEETAFETILFELELEV